MRDKLLTLPGIESGEEPIISILLAQSVFLGIFIGAFDITAHSLLLTTFNEKMMARGYIVSGIIGIVFISLNSFLQRRLQFKNLAIINLFTVTLLTLFLWSAMISSPSKWIIFLVFVMFGPLNILALTVFRETSDKLITRKQDKRLLRITDIGIIIGIIIIAFVIPLIISVKFYLRDVLFISASSVFIAAIIQSFIGAKFSGDSIPGDKTAEKTEMRRYLSAVFRDDLYIRTIAIFAALSVLTTFFIQYLFMAITRQQYPVTEDMARFLGFFTGSMMIFILFVKLVLFPYLIHTYGLRVSLILSPVLIVVITVITITTCLLLGYNPESASGFLIFFFLLAFSRIISKSLKDSVELPSLKVVYKSVDKKIRAGFGSGMSGILNEIPVIAAGLILTGIGLFSFMKLIHFSLFLFIIVILWLFVAIRLSVEHKKSVIKAVDTRRVEKSETVCPAEKDILQNRFAAYLAFRTDYFKLISGDFSAFDTINNKWYYTEIIDNALSKKDKALLPVLNKIVKNTMLDETVRHKSAEVIEILKNYYDSHKSGDGKTDKAIKILSDARMPHSQEILRLLRDNSAESKRLAIFMIGKFRLTDLLSDVCRCMSIPGLTIDAFEVLKTFGSVANDDLIRFYFISSGNTKLSRTILQLLGRNLTGETTGFLFSILMTNSRSLKETAAKCLIDGGFKPSENEKHRLDQLISEVIGSITWNLSAKITLEKNNDSFLPGEINREIDRWNRFLYNILSINYNSGVIDMIMENIRSGISGNINYAYEMADIVLSDSIRLKVISLFDFVPDEVRIKNLQQFYPGEIPVYNKMLEDIINRDYNLISLWTKACALRSIARIENPDMAESVTALLFSPEELIQEESANLIARSNPDLYKSASGRLSGSIKKRLDKIINGTVYKEEFLFEKVRFLSDRIGIIGEDESLTIAGEMKYIKNFDRESLLFSEGFFIWPLYKDNETDEVYVVYNGDIEKLVQKQQEWSNISFYLLTFSAIEEYNFQFPEKSFEILKYIENKEK